MRPGPIIAAAICACVAAYFYFAGRTSFAYAESWSSARERARSEKKPIFLNFGGPW